MNRAAVLIPHFNNLAGLRASLASIDAEDPADIYVVDDGSPTPPTDDQVAAAVPGMRRVTVLALDNNVGIEGALNAGLDRIIADGYEYIARLDCGDRNVGRRFATQIAYLDAHPQILLLGGAAQFGEPQGALLFVRQLPTTHELIVSFMRPTSAFMHPAVMFRASAAARIGHYPTAFPAAEDYAYFWRFMDAGEVANLPQVLIEYEVDPGSISRSKRSLQLHSRLQIQRLHSDGSLQARMGMWRTRALLVVPVALIDALKARRYGQP